MHPEHEPYTKPANNLQTAILEKLKNKTIYLLSPKALVFTLYCWFSLFATVIVLKTIKYKSGKQFNLYFATMRNRREIQQLCEFVV